jgi:multiple sugar transport system permease protein
LAKRFALKQSRDARNRRLGMLYTLPCALVILIMTIYPLVQMIVFSFSKVTLPFFDLQFVGLDNFVKMVGAKTFGKIIGNTFIWTFVALVLRFLLGFSSALLMETGFRGKTPFRIITLMPWVVPSIVTANLWRWIYNMDNGILNKILSSINPDLALNWLGSKDTALFAVVLAYVWQGFPFIMLMIVSAMQGIPKSYTEAALVDGANRFQVFRHVTLPNLKNVLSILAVLEVINGFNAFDLLFTMTGGGPGVSSEILGLYIYRTAFSNFNFGGASAMGLMLLLAVLLCFVYYAQTQRKKEA